MGQSCDGVYQAGKSRTFAVDVSTLYQMFKEPRRRRKWLTEGWKRVRTSIEDKSIRVDWEDGTQANFYFTAKSAEKATVAVQHEKLADKAHVERAKAFWAEQLDHLKAELAAR